MQESTGRCPVHFEREGLFIEYIPLGKEVIMDKKEKKANPDRLPVGTFFAWRGGAFTISANIMIMGQLVVYATEALHMSAALIGTLLLISKVLDAVGETFAGYLIDRCNFKLGKGRPWDLCVIGLWACTVLMYSCPADASIAFKSVWIFVTYLLVQSVFQTLMQAGSTAYTLRAFANQRVIVKNQSYGAVVSMLLSIVISAIMPSLIKNMATSPVGWTKLIILFAIPLTIIGFTRFIFVKEKYPSPDTKEEPIQFKNILDVFKSNKYIWLVVGMSTLVNIFTGINVGYYYFTYIVGDLGKLGTMSMISIVLLPALFLIPKIIKKFSLAKLIAVGSIISVSGAILMFFAGSNIPVILTASLLTALGMMAPPYMIGVLIFDCARYNVWKGKRSMEATMAAINNFGSQLGSGIGSMLLGFCLSIGGYVGGAKVQTGSALLMIRLLMSLIPGVFYFIMFLTSNAYKLEKLMPQIEQELNERRAAAKTVQA
jgi:Na+/melibiose symporter-like transporter